MQDDTGIQVQEVKVETEQSPVSFKLAENDYSAFDEKYDFSIREQTREDSKCANADLDLSLISNKEESS